MLIWVVLGWIFTVCLLPVVILVSGSVGAHGEGGLKVTRGILFGFGGWIIVLVVGSVAACTA